MRPWAWKAGIALALVLTALQIYLIGRMLHAPGRGKPPKTAGAPAAPAPEARRPSGAPAPGGAPPPGGADVVPTAPSGPGVSAPKGPQGEIFFPDLALGIIQMDRERALQLSREQARKLLPLLEDAVKSLEEKNRKELQCSDLLDGEQREYIRKHRREIAQVVLTTSHESGEDPVVAYAEDALRGKIRRELAPKAPLPQKSQAPGSEPGDVLTYMDICLGAVALEKVPALSLRTGQVSALMPLLRDVGKANMKLRARVGGIRGVLKPSQLEYIQKNQSTFFEILPTLPSAGVGGDVVTAALLNTVKARLEAQP